MKPQSKLLEIQNPIKEEMKLFEKKFQESMRSKAPLLDRIMGFIVRRKGKQMRPMFVLLTAQMFGGINETTYRGASLIELLHTATLVHDDVVDDAQYRRGFFSINALWKNKIAVLVGDYLLSKGLLLSVENKEFGLLEIVSNAVREMSEGELLQIEKARKLDISEDIYFEIIRQKTATLISSCCEVGAYSTKTSEQDQQRAASFGEKVGMAFQIKDDLFDYGEEEIGKPRGIDIQEKKLTLPLIYSLNQSSYLEKRKVIRMIKGSAKDRKKVQKVIEFVRSKGGIEYAKGVMNKLKKEAMEILRSFPDSQSRHSLEALVEFTISRKR